MGNDAAKWMPLGQQLPRYPMLEFLNLAGKVIFDGLRGWIQRVSGQGIGPWSSPNAEVDATRCECFEDPKLFGYFER